MYRMCFVCSTVLCVVLCTVLNKACRAINAISIRSECHITITEDKSKRDLTVMENRRIINHNLSIQRVAFIDDTHATRDILLGMYFITFLLLPTSYGSTTQLNSRNGLYPAHIERDRRCLQTSIQTCQRKIILL